MQLGKGRPAMTRRRTNSSPGTWSACMRTVISIGVCLLAACNENGPVLASAGDAGGGADLARPVAAGPTYKYVINSLSLLFYDSGIDLNGDGKPDNRLSEI